MGFHLSQQTIFRRKVRCLEPNQDCRVGAYVIDHSERVERRGDEPSALLLYL